MRKYVVLFLIILVFICSGCTVHKDSVDDNHLLEKPAVYQLDGEWRMYPSQLLEPSEIHQGDGIQVYAPLSFERWLGDEQGYATFYKVIELDPVYIDQLMSVYSQYMYTAYKLYIDGQLVMQAGQVGEDKQHSIPEMQAKLGYFQPKQSNIELVLQISNFHHQQGGVNNDFVIGTVENASNYYHYQLYNMFLQIGSIVIMGVFAILVSILARGQILFFVYGFFCLLMAMRALFSGTIFANVLLPELSWLAITRMEYLITEWVSIVYLISIYLLYRDKYLKYILYFATTLAVILTIITLFTEVSTFQFWFRWMFMICIPILFYTMLLPFVRLRRKNLLGLWLVAGSLLMLAAVVNDYLVSLDLIASKEMALYGALALVICQAIYVSCSYTNELKRSKYLIEELQMLTDTMDEKVQQSMQDVIKSNEQLQQEIWIDGLTKTYNRKYFSEKFETLFLKGENIGLILIDIDDFKRFNDTYGHVAGDKLLVELVQVANEQIPHNGFLARYGGEEFAVVLEDSSKQQTLDVATAIRRAVEAMGIQHKNASNNKKILTVSLGVSFMKHRKQYKKPIDFIKQADNALYRAKNNGRNQVGVLK